MLKYWFICRIKLPIILDKILCNLLLIQICQAYQKYLFLILVFILYVQFNVLDFQIIYPSHFVHIYNPSDSQCTVINWGRTGALIALVYIPAPFGIWRSQRRLIVLHSLQSGTKPFNAAASTAASVPLVGAPYSALHCITPIRSHRRIVDTTSTAESYT